jgi:anti-sigma B factor antagonist
MPAPVATVSARVLDQTIAIIDVSGDLTAACEGLLMDAYAEAGGEHLRAVVLNLSGLEYMNSSGIGLLVTLLVRVNRHKQRLLTYGLTDHYREIFDLTRLDDAIGIYADEPEAIDAARA